MGEQIYPDIDNVIEKPHQKKKVTKKQILQLMSDQHIEVKKKCPKCGEKGMIIKKENIVIKEQIPTENIIKWGIYFAQLNTFGDLPY